jgi:hypothetical protein
VNDIDILMIALDRCPWCSDDRHTLSCDEHAHLLSAVCERWEHSHPAERRRPENAEADETWFQRRYGRGELT